MLQDSHRKVERKKKKILSYFLFLLNDFITIYTKPSVRLPTKNFTLTKLHPTKSSASMLSLTVLLLVEHAIHICFIVCAYDEHFSFHSSQFFIVTGKGKDFIIWRCSFGIYSTEIWQFQEDWSVIPTS